MRVLTTPCIFISVHYMFNVSSVLTVFQVLSGQRSRATQSEQSWLAFLLPLTLLVCQQCRAYGQFVPRWLGCTQTSSTWSCHLRLRRQAGETHTYMQTAFVRLPYIPWSQLTAADVSQLALRTNLNKGRLSQVGCMSSRRLQSPFLPTGNFKTLFVWNNISWVILCRGPFPKIYNV